MSTKKRSNQMRRNKPVYNDNLSEDESSQSDKSNGNAPISKTTSKRSKYTTPLSNSLPNSLRKSSRSSMSIPHSPHVTGVDDHVKDAKLNTPNHPECHVGFNKVEISKYDNRNINILILKVKYNIFEKSIPLSKSVMSSLIMFSKDLHVTIYHSFLWY